MHRLNALLLSFLCSSIDTFPSLDISFHRHSALVTKCSCGFQVWVIGSVRLAEDCAVYNRASYVFQYMQCSPLGLNLRRRRLSLEPYDWMGPFLHLVHLARSSKLQSSNSTLPVGVPRLWTSTSSLRCTMCIPVNEASTSTRSFLD